MSLGKRLRAFFLDRPVPDAVFQISQGFLSGIRVSPRERAARRGLARPFARPPLAPSFDRPNITDAGAVAEALARAKDDLHLSAGSAAILIPETSVRVFVLAVDSFPASGRERDAFIRWRISRQMPALPEDVRVNYAAQPGRGAQRILVALARASVVQEYEDLWEQAGLRPDVVTVPSLALANLLRTLPPAAGILLNVEEDVLALLAVNGSGWALYRQKSVGQDDPESRESRVDNIVREVENTLRFLEDKEKIQVEKIWVRSVATDQEPLIAARLGQRTGLQVEPIPFSVPAGWSRSERTLLAPLLGQIQ